MRMEVYCHAAGYPNLQVNWKRNGAEIMNHQNSTVGNSVYTYTYGFQNVASGLRFSKVHCRDSGNYTCETSIGDYVESGHVHVEIKCKSHIFRQLNIIYLFRIWVQSK